jgi:hypothetical protein
LSKRRRKYSYPAEYAPLFQLSGSPIVPAVRRQLVKARAITLRRGKINLNARLNRGLRRGPLVLGPERSVALAWPLPHVGQLAFFDVPDDLIEPTTIMPYPARGFDEPDMARVAICSRRGSL